MSYFLSALNITVIQHCLVTIGKHLNCIDTDINIISSEEPKAEAELEHNDEAHQTQPRQDQTAHPNVDPYHLQVICE